MYGKQGQRSFIIIKQNPKNGYNVSQNIGQWAQHQKKVRYANMEVVENIYARDMEGRLERRCDYEFCLCISHYENTPIQMY